MEALEATVAALHSSLQHMCTMLNMAAQSALFLPSTLSPRLPGQPSVLAAPVPPRPPRSVSTCVYLCVSDIRTPNMDKLIKIAANWAIN
jgi:hypothetical protein